MDREENPQKTLAIFGVEGFLGQQAYIQTTSPEFQKKHNWKVIGVSKRKHPFSSFIIDITYKNNLQNFLKSQRIDYVLWYAAKSIPSFSTDNESEVFKINVLPLHSVFEVLEPTTVFLYPSSRHVYAKSHQKHSEDSDVSAQSVYARHKLQSERIVLESSVNSIVVRNFNFIGPNPVPLTFMHDVLGQLGNAEIEVFNQNQILDVVDIRDGVRAHLHLLTASNRHHRIYNVCRGFGVSIEKVVQKIISNDVGIVSKYPVDNPPIVGDSIRLESTGFQFLYDLDDTIRCILSVSS